VSYFIVEKQNGSSEKKDWRVAWPQQGGTKRGGAEGSADACSQQSRPQSRPQSSQNGS